MEESRVFVKYFAELKKNVTHPEKIAAKLHERGVITDSEMDAVLNRMATTQMDKLLSAVQKAIQINKTNFDIFMEVLNLEQKYGDLVKEMRAAREGYMDEEKVFVRFYAKLRSDVNPENICAELFAKDIITPAEKGDIELEVTASVQSRMNKLLNAVQAAIGIDKENFHTFLDVLHASDKKYEPLVARMKEDVRPSVN